MLDPARMAAFRTAIGDDPECAAFAGLPCRRVGLAAATPVAPVWSQPAGCYAPTPPAALFGTPIDPECLTGVYRKRIDLPASVWLRLDDAAVISPQAVLTGDGRLYAPEPVGAAPTEAGGYDHHGFVVGGDPASVWHFGRPTARTLASDALFLPDLEPGNHGSFLFRQLPLLIAARRLEPAWDCYVVPARTPALREAVDLLALPRRPVLTVAEVSGDRFRSVLLPAGFDQEGVLSAATLEGLRQLRRRVGRPAGSPRPSRLYVSRQLPALARPWYRPLRNESQAQTLAEQFGFTPCWPETLSLAEQISLFAGAKLMLGPSGSGLLNAIFALAGSRVLDLESYQVTVRQHANLYASSGKRYAFAFGRLADDATGTGGIRPPLAERPWMIDLDILEQGLVWLAGRKC